MNCVIINKSGDLKDGQIKDDDLETLNKKCGFKTIKNFEERVNWRIKVKGVKYSIKLFAKDDGRANSENKYDFPPPVDNQLYFGSCILINYGESDTLTPFDCEEWESIYDKLFGGFEDLSANIQEDEEEEDELDMIEDTEKTKEGYLKDGFVVDDSTNSIDDDYYSELDEDDYLYSDEESK